MLLPLDWNFCREIIARSVYLKNDLKESHDTGHEEKGGVWRSDTGHMQRQLLTGV